MNLLLNEQEPITAATEECMIHETAVWRRNVSIYALCSCKTSSIAVLDMLRGDLPFEFLLSWRRAFFFQFCPTIAKLSMLY